MVNYIFVTRAKTVYCTWVMVNNHEFLGFGMRAKTVHCFRVLECMHTYVYLHMHLFCASLFDVDLDVDVTFQNLRKLSNLPPLPKPKSM